MSKPKNYNLPETAIPTLEQICDLALRHGGLQAFQLVAKFMQELKPATEPLVEPEQVG